MFGLDGMFTADLGFCLKWGVPVNCDLLWYFPATCCYVTLCLFVPSLCLLKCLPVILCFVTSTLCQKVVTLSLSVSQCPERNARPPHMRAFNRAVGVVFNSSGDDNCGLRDGLLVKAAAVRVDFRAVIAAR